MEYETKFSEHSKYLEEVVKELNANCSSLKKVKNNRNGNDNCNDNNSSYEWEIDNISPIITKYKNYCYVIDEYSYYEKRGLCESCESILEEKIRKYFNQTQLYLSLEDMYTTKNEFADIRLEIANKKEEFEDTKNYINKKIDEIQEKVELLIINLDNRNIPNTS